MLVGVAVGTCVFVPVATGVEVWVWLGRLVAVAVGVGVPVLVGTGVEVGVSLGRLVGVAVAGGVPVVVGTGVAVVVGVPVGVLVAVLVGVGVCEGIGVGVFVTVTVGNAVAVSVGSGVDVCVGVCVADGVAVGVRVAVAVPVGAVVAVGVIVGVTEGSGPTRIVPSTALQATCWLTIGGPGAVSTNSVHWPIGKPTEGGTNVKLFRPSACPWNVMVKSGVVPLVVREGTQAPATRTTPETVFAKIEQPLAATVVAVTTAGAGVSYWSQTLKLLTGSPALILTSTLVVANGVAIVALGGFKSSVRGGTVGVTVGVGVCAPANCASNSTNGTTTPTAWTSAALVSSRHRSKPPPGTVIHPHLCHISPESQVEI
jgi:hypothetical protein